VVIVNESEQKLETQAISLFTAEDETKLDGIETGAEVNVQSDWNESDPDSDAYIFNKPTFNNGVPKLYFVADGVANSFDIGVNSEIKAVFEEGALLDDNDWAQAGSVFTLTYIPDTGKRIKPI
jgi:hypothetical protein